jgi:hypothetical protein
MAQTLLHVREVQALDQGATVAKHTADVIVIVPGFNANKSAYYSREALADAVKAGLFEGARMFLNHGDQDAPDPGYDRDIDRYVAVLSNPHVREDGAVLGTAKIVDDPFALKLENFKRQDVLAHMGVSINVLAEAEQRIVEGIETQYISRFLEVLSVDFTPVAGAGGKVLYYEAKHVEAFEPEAFARTYPKIATALLQEANKKEWKLMEIEEIKKKVAALEAAQAEWLKEREGLIAAKEAAEKMLAEMDKALSEATAAAEQAKAGAEIEKAVVEAALPDAAKDRLRESLKDYCDIAAAQTAIATEVAYVAKLTEAAAHVAGGAPKIVGLGPATPDAASTQKVFDEAKARFLQECGDPAVAERMARAYVG